MVYRAIVELFKIFLCVLKKTQNQYLCGHCHWSEKSLNIRGIETIFMSREQLTKERLESNIQVKLSINICKTVHIRNLLVFSCIFYTLLLCKLDVLSNYSNFSDSSSGTSPEKFFPAQQVNTKKKKCYFTIHQEHNRTLNIKVGFINRP